jgi:hypothetical protein
LFQERPALLFDRAGLTVSGAAAYRPKASEVKQAAFRLDGVLIPPPDAADAPLVCADLSVLVPLSCDPALVGGGPLSTVRQEQP